MLDEQKYIINLQIDILKEIMRQDELVFDFKINETDVSKSALIIISKNDFDKGNKNGMEITFEKLNEGLR